ncbi:hypothetical protein ABZU22_25220 [Micromonospora sp. NPDC005222]|uniref:hypothetical protein n=1 Tax=Micromonospora sp. NPDC005222 TaxID=3157025 RepID=UPI0033A7C618
MAQLDAIKDIAAKIHAEKVIKKLTVAGSVAYITDHAGDLARFQYLDDLAEELIRDEVDENVRAISFHLENVRNALARELWQQGLGVGPYTLDELLFGAVKNGDSNPVVSVLERLRRSEKNAPGLVVFPLHSFGVLAAGLLKPFRRASYILVRPGAGYALTIQTNSLRETISLIDGTRSRLGVTKQLDPSLFWHWRESRGADWLERNPLLIARMTTIAGYYNENEFLTLGRLQVITASIVMMAAMQSRREEQSAWFFSSGAINNWQTTDVNHYFILTSSHDQVLRGESVPIHDHNQVREMAGLAVDVDPRHFRRESARSSAIFSSLEALFRGYLKHSIDRQNSTVGNVHRKIMEAVTFFRRSFQPGRDDWTAVISLATAFEMLLTDRFEGGVKARLMNRTQTLLRGVNGTRRYQAAVDALYVARSETVHEGKVSRLDLYDARQAFVLCFLEIMRRLPQLREDQPNPMQHLTI